MQAETDQAGARDREGHSDQQHGNTVPSAPQPLLQGLRFRANSRSQRTPFGFRQIGYPNHKVCDGFQGISSADGK